MSLSNFRILNCRNHVFVKLKCSYYQIPSKSQSTASKPILRPKQKFKTIGPVGWFLLIIPASSFSLGVWQIKRKTWKENLIADLQMGINSDPIPLPNSLEEINELEYKPVHVKGYFLHDKELFIGPRSLLVKGDSTTQSSFFADRSNSNGYLVVTPFKLANREETILVSRGWVPAKNRESKTRQNGQVEGPVDVIGIVRLHENRPSFTPKNKGSDIYFYRDLQQMSAATGSLPIFLDATNDFDVPDGPIGGQTRVSLRNEHLSYILTWFALGTATSYMWYTRFIK